MAARILGKAFVGENITVDKPEPLRISGIDDGLRRMLGDDYEKSAWAGPN